MTCQTLVAIPESDGAGASGTRGKTSERGMYPHEHAVNG